MDAPLCTLVHISDPHFGPGFVIDGEERWRELVAKTPCLRHVTGYYPHGYQAATALAIAVRQILRDRRDRGIPALVVHTGDLTAGGARAEFSTGSTFLRHGHYLENGTLAGLRLETEFGQIPFDIPGNHDLWSRRDPKDHAAFTSHYGGQYPRRVTVPTRSGKVILYGLDSNRGSLWQHRLANGEIPDEDLGAVCGLLRSEAGSGVIQAVCTHHPLAIRPRAAPRLFGWEILRLRNRDTVAKALGSAGAHLTLAGHVHSQYRIPRRGTVPAHFVAGSACQILSRPAFWLLDLHDSSVRFSFVRIPRGGIQYDVAHGRSGSAAYH